MSKSELFNHLDAVEDDSLPFGAWQCHLMDVVEEWNQTNGTNHDPYNTWLEWVERRSAGNE